MTKAGTRVALPGKNDTCTLGHKMQSFVYEEGGGEREEGQIGLTKECIKGRFGAMLVVSSV